MKTVKWERGDDPNEFLVDLLEMLAPDSEELERLVQLALDFPPELENPFD